MHLNCIWKQWKRQIKLKKPIIIYIYIYAHTVVALLTYLIRVEPEKASVGGTIVHNLLTKSIA